MTLESALPQLRALLQTKDLLFFDVPCKDVDLIAELAREAKLEGWIAENRRDGAALRLRRPFNYDVPPAY